MPVIFNILVNWSKAIIITLKVDTDTPDANKISSFEPMIHVSQVTAMLLPELPQVRPRKHLDESTGE